MAWPGALPLALAPELSWGPAPWLPTPARPQREAFKAPHS